jgi:NAD-dependent deacetylase
MLDPAHLDRAAKAIDACDVMLVVGTSALVYPAAGFPEDAGRAGKPVIEINPEETPLTASVDVSVRMGARDALRSWAAGSPRRAIAKSVDPRPRVRR